MVKCKDCNQEMDAKGGGPVDSCNCVKVGVTL